jgi:uncharacterized protein YigE (DUF2233 family)
MKLRYVPFLLLIACSPADSTKKTPSAKTTQAAEAEAPEEPPCSPGWQELEPGLRYRTLGCSETKPTDLHVVELDPSQWQIDAVAGEPATSVSVARAGDYAVALNANFFDEAKKPLGIVVSGGEVKNPLHPVSWQSVFYVDKNGDVGIQPQAEWSAIAGNVSAAVQCGPRLVINGTKNQVAKGDASLRSGVCVTAEKKVLFFVTPQDRYFDVHEMVELAADPGALGCRDAMLFDGGPSAQLHLDSSIDVTIEGDLVPAHIVAKRRG